MLAGQADRIRKNDFSGPELTAEGEDEISRLIRSFNKMKQATRGYIEALKKKKRNRTAAGGGPAAAFKKSDQSPFSF